MYIEIDEPLRGRVGRTIIPMVPTKDYPPYVKPWRPYPMPRPDRDWPEDIVRPIIPFPNPGQPFIPKVPISDDDEYPVSKEDILREAKNKENSLHESIMRNSRRKINAGLRTGQRIFKNIEIDGRIRNKEIDMLVSEYKAAGWSVIKEVDFLEFD